MIADTVSMEIHTRIHSTCRKHRVQGLLRSHFPGKRARQFRHSEEKEKKPLFNGEKWEAGEELAVAAGIINGNCLGTRLRFMGRTTHGGAGNGNAPEA